MIKINEEAKLWFKKETTITYVAHTSCCIVADLQSNIFFLPVTINSISLFQVG